MEMESQDETERRATALEARAAEATLRRFAEQQEKGDCLFGHLGIVEDKVDEISSSKLKQKTLLDFFFKRVWKTGRVKSLGIS